ncbi:cytochrome c oxidase accessory protein FixG [Plasticicumulans lactativorans]|uniref:Cytochrome c oxidase accessory protein FixG n=1 Tax=Plasticicumulans lactativorans TaxID=1133106 RepID=A0A4R2LCN2_9GAMM|nr:cytochrome c oxidase accessory protein CcoG [Plasticicumulans lactativorans]TCO82259.1 cytochrome c oxidase accessory protein FixG [Plasticicumulans lactativorans]
MAEAEVQLYQKRLPIHPRSVQGRFRNIKYAVLALAYSVYFLLPWVRWERPMGVNQALLFDIPGRKFYVFDLVVQAQDIFWLAGLLVIAAMLLFFVTGVAGRVFCGYFCFQTLWTDVFVLIERWVQGERPARLRLAKQPWDAEKRRKMLTTWGLWLATSFLTGLTFTLYWADAPTLVWQMLTLSAPFPAYATTFLLTSTTFVMAGLAREQVCTYMCPYARFQSVMFDRDTLIIAYDQKRGEGTAGRARITKEMKTREERAAAGIGDCIDCGYCVQVCPVGIDIRKGLQLQCISCALCVDACDSIMDNLGWPRRLIAYTSDNAQQGKPTRVLKPKTLGYGVALAAAIVALGWSVATREPLDVSVEQVRQPLSVTLSDGRIQNSYEIKLNSKVTAPGRVRIAISGLDGAELDLGGLDVVTLDPEQRLRVMAKIKLTMSGSGGRREFQFVLTPDGALGQAPIRLPVTFHGP